MIEAARLRDLIDYDPETGEMRWRHTRGPCVGGSIVGCLSPQGYRIGFIDGRVRSLHRMVILHVTGALPPTGMEVDHIDGDRANNRWANLRVVTKGENMQNRRRPSRNNKSGFLGVSRTKHPSRQRRPWLAQIKLTTDGTGKVKNLGFYATPEEAHAVYVTAKRRMHAGCTI